MDSFEKELKQSFLQEAWQMLQDTEMCFLLLEQSRQDENILAQIFRFAHNLKGSAKAVGFTDLGEFIHEFENFLGDLKSQRKSLSEDVVDLLLLCNDHLKVWIKKLTEDLSAKIDSEDLLRRLRGNEKSRTETIVDESALKLVFDSNKQNDFEETKALHFDESIRVSTQKLERLMNNVGELVILQSVLNQYKNIDASPLMTKTINQLGKITKDIQDISMSLRMMSLKQTFQKIQRIVRDTSNELGKEIQCIVEGEDTEVDKTVIENLSDPLVHLVRNAVDHGIESPDERASVGKSTRGRIYIRAFHTSGKICIQLRDDGRGLNPEKLKQKAIEKKIISQDETLTEQEAQHLIFKPGFTTKESVNDISGRGVGMDVVKTNIEKILRGKITLSSQPGMGTLFNIELPLTLAIIEGMIVSFKHEKYVIPLIHVHESLRLDKKMINHVSGLGRVLTLRDSQMPLHRLSDLLKLPSPKNQNVRSDGMALILRSETGTFAVEVDDILSQQQIVIKSLGKEVQELNGVIGGAILGDGKAVLILDLEDLVMKSQISSSGTIIQGKAI